MSQPNKDPKPDSPDNLDKPDEYAVFMNFKERDKIDLEAVEQTVHFSKKKSAAMIKQLDTNPNKYIELKQARYADSGIPSGVARPDAQTMTQLDKMFPADGNGSTVDSEVEVEEDDGAQSALQSPQGAESTPPSPQSAESTPPSPQGGPPSPQGGPQGAPQMRAPVQLVVSQRVQRVDPVHKGVQSVDPGALGAGAVDPVEYGALGAGAVDPEEFGACGGESTYGEYAAEVLERSGAPPRSPDTAPSTGGAVAQMTHQDAAVRTQQIIIKVALNPSNVLGYDIIHAIDPELTTFPANASWISSTKLPSSTE